jgi:CheY-like chemotaxis protein
MFLIVRLWMTGLERAPRDTAEREMSTRTSDVPAGGRPQSAASVPKDAEGRRLGGARADFVASLGRKVNDARELLLALADDASAKQPRDELRRRLHALGAGARLLRFDAMGQSVQEALVVLERAALVGTLGERDVAFVAQIVEDLPALAWGESPSQRAMRAAEEEAAERSARAPVAVLLVGPESLAAALTKERSLGSRYFECEQTADAPGALQLARVQAPDLLVVDADLPRAAELVEALLDDPLTEPVPIVVVGTFARSPERREGPGTERTIRSVEASRFVALGVARTLPKPVAPAALRGACDEILDAREGRTMRITLGEPTLEQLADRLGEELRRALVESVDRPAQRYRVPLGEGTEVLGALWGAIARVQEIVTQKTGGAVRFGGEAPEGAVALAPWLHHEVAASERTVARGRGGAVDVRLQGRRIIVVDDDPGVTWFIADLLRTAGCEVHEALDGRAALDMAYRVEPEVVVSDILMPGLDGFALSRALHRDVALRDVPVILLSWKEDLLQRVRELGASAAAYMKKDGDSRVILARIREVLRPRARIEMRLRDEGEVRGRLDGLTARLLLELVGAARKNARVAVRDACFLFEVELRDGQPRKATRTASDGGFVRGERALASLLGVSSGRFVVSASAEAIRGELTGTLSEQLVRPLAEIRGALAATTGTQTVNVERLVLDEVALDETMRAIPGPARALVKRLAGGASPRQILLAGDVSPSLVEDVLADLAIRGVVRGVQGARGTDVLTPAIEAALAAVRGPRKSSNPPSPSPSRPALPTSQPQTPSVATHRAAVIAPPVVAPPAMQLAAVVPPEPPPEERFEAFTLSEPPAAPVSEEEPDSAAPASLEDAVMRQLGDSPHPGAAAPSIVEPSQLRPRSSNPPEGLELLSDEGAPLPSIPPDAVVPAAISGEEQAAPPSAPDLSESPPEAPPPSAPRHEQRSQTQPLPPSLPPAPPPLDRTLRLPAAPAPRSVDRAASAAPPPKRSPWPIVLAFVALGLAVGAVWHARSADGPPAASSARAPERVPGAVAPALGPASALATFAAGPPSTASAGRDPGASAVLASGYGLVEVTVPTGVHVRIDGAIAGSGPTLSLVAAPGYHEVRIEQDGGYSKHVVEVQSGRTTRIDSAQLP